MELAIPGVALGLMYVMNNQSNNNNSTEENFSNRNALPNTNLPNKNYPEEYPIVSEELDKTSSLSTVNRFENGGSVYTDKYFDANMHSNNNSTSGSTEFYSLTGEKVNNSYFEHNKELLLLRL